MATTYYRADFKHGAEYRSSQRRKYGFAALCRYPATSWRPAETEVSFHGAERNVPRDAVEVVAAYPVDAKLAKIGMLRNRLIACTDEAILEWHERRAETATGEDEIGHAKWRLQEIREIRARAIADLAAHMAKHGEV